MTYRPWRDVLLCAAGWSIADRIAGEAILESLDVPVFAVVTAFLLWVHRPQQAEEGDR